MSCPALMRIAMTMAALCLLSPGLSCGGDKVVLSCAYGRSGVQTGPRLMKALVRMFLDGTLEELQHSFPLGLDTALFQAEIYAMKVCVMENMEKGRTSRSICILSGGRYSS